MNRELHNYPFPNAVVLFWFLSSPMILILILLIIFRTEIFAKTPSNEIIINLICLSIIRLIVIPTLAYLFANSFPALRLNPNGLEIQIYSPLKTKYLFLSWGDIDRVVIYSDPLPVLFQRKKKWIFIQSRRLPFFYFLLSMLYRNSLHRGFIITHHIQRYEEVLDFISEHKTE